ncbi:MAG: nucleotidyltransferase domain-containing protein [Candidatus Omnitrophica bacterium]|nr:nucleotidyltransferase domain-containing protein [Candidatus Omnitrophota bacterium]
MIKKNENPSNGLSQDDKESIVRILLEQKTIEKILLFGSRARKDYKSTSDIDIAIVDAQWTDRDINLAKDALEEKIKTPLKIDLVNYHGLKNERLKQHILGDGQVLYDSRKNP